MKKQFFYSLLLLGVICWYQSIQAQGKVIDKIIAKVDDYVVLKSELEAQYYQLVVNGAIKVGSSPCELFERLLINKMMLAKAEIDSVIVPEEEVAGNLDRRMSYFIAQFGSEERLEEQYGKTIPELKGELREQIREQLTIQQMEREITSDIEKPTPREVKRFFNRIPKDSLPEFGVEVEVAHIVKIPTVSESQKNMARKKLLDIRNRIEGGEDFAELAKQYSEDYSNANKGGDLGWQKRGFLAPPFEAAVYRTKPGEMSGVVETQFGFHLIKLHERRGNEFHCSHILVRPDFSQVDVKAARNYLDSLRTLIISDSITFAKAAKEYSEDPNSAANGGTITAYGGSNRIFKEDLDSYLYFTIDTMKVGNISTPVTYRLDDGRDAVRIIYFKSQTQAHTANLERDYQKIYDMVYDEKRMEAINEWFDKTKREVYIYIDQEYQGCDVLKSQ